MKLFTTAADLRAKGACPDDVEIAEEEWPDGVELSEAVLVRAAKLELDLQWFVATFFPSIYGKYMRQVISLWGNYKQEAASLRIEGSQQKIPALLAEYWRQKALLAWRLIEKS